MHPQYGLQNNLQNYQQGLKNSGHQNANQGGENCGWRPMSTAPRDGTVIEVRCTSGVAPWYGLYHWTNKMMVQGQVMNCQDFRWAKVGDECSGFTEDESFRWRPSAGLANAVYVDPTNGAQDTEQYWRRAAARSAGLPQDYFDRPWWKFW